MISSFNNRIDAQRKILNIVNSYSWKEELFGLTEGAINRWQKNNILINESIITTLREIGEILFFLGTKSQEQITDDYNKLSVDIESLYVTLVSFLKEYK